MEVRPATPDDAHEFTVLVKKFVREANYPFKVDMKLTYDNALLILENPDFFLHVVEDEEELVGFLVGALNKTLFSTEVIATELGWYLKPEYRDGRTALKLLKNYEEWAKEQGADFVTMVDIDTVQDLSALYQRRGYELTEKSYVRKF